MRTISIINLKGGCAKTLSSINIAYVLASVHGGRVLLLDNDKQGDASKIMNRHGYERPGTADILTERKIGMSEVIQVTDYEGLDIITANMNLLTASLTVMLGQKRPQHNRFERALAQVDRAYDFCVIDKITRKAVLGQVWEINSAVLPGETADRVDQPVSGTFAGPF